MAVDDVAVAQERSGQTLRHGVVEDIFGMASGCFVAALGISIMHSANLVTGGTAGLALLLSYALPVGLPVLFLLVNLPFFALGIGRKGWSFAVRSAVAVAATSALAAVNAHLIGPLQIEPVYAAVVGNLVSGIGVLILFRHGASLGGFGIVALIAQERLRWRAGYVQMVLDAGVLLGSLAVAPVRVTVISTLGAVILNGVIALNHRPGRYRGEVSRLTPWW
ncbi:MAG: YitT family protein [Gordonia sp. (in: high G+C Gram-positive bacteria)]